MQNDLEVMWAQLKIPDADFDVIALHRHLMHGALSEP